MRAQLVLSGPPQIVVEKVPRREVYAVVCVACGVVGRQTTVAFAEMRAETHRDQHESEDE